MVPAGEPMNEVMGTLIDFWRLVIQLWTAEILISVTQKFFKGAITKRGVNFWEQEFPVVKLAH